MLALLYGALLYIKDIINREIRHVKQLKPSDVGYLIIGVHAWALMAFCSAVCALCVCACAMLYN